MICFNNPFVLATLKPLDQRLGIHLSRHRSVQEFLDACMVSQVCNSKKGTGTATCVEGVPETQ